MTERKRREIENEAKEEPKEERKEESRRKGASKGWSWWRWCKEGWRQHKEKEKRGEKGEKKGVGGRRRKKGWSLEQMVKWLFLILPVMRNIGAVRARSDNVQNGKESWRKPNGRGRFAADAARITDEHASCEDCRHMWGGVLVAVDGDLGAVVAKEEGAVMSIPGNEGRIAQAWVDVTGGMRFLWCTSGFRKDGRREMRP